jgi:hypothetical protein
MFKPYVLAVPALDATAGAPQSVSGLFGSISVCVSAFVGTIRIEGTLGGGAPWCEEQAVTGNGTDPVTFEIAVSFSAIRVYRVSVTGAVPSVTVNGRRIDDCVRG